MRTDSGMPNVGDNPLQHLRKQAVGISSSISSRNRRGQFRVHLHVARNAPFASSTSRLMATGFCRIVRYIRRTFAACSSWLHQPPQRGIGLPQLFHLWEHIVQHVVVEAGGRGAGGGSTVRIIRAARANRTTWLRQRPCAALVPLEASRRCLRVFFCNVGYAGRGGLQFWCRHPAPE